MSRQIAIVEAEGVNPTLRTRQLHFLLQSFFLRDYWLVPGDRFGLVTDLLQCHHRLLHLAVVVQGLH